MDFLSFRKALIAFCLLLFSHLVQAQCIHGPTNICGGATGMYAVNPADVPTGTANIFWTATNGTIVPPTSGNSATVQWNNNGTGVVHVDFRMTGGISLGTCDLEVALHPTPVATLNPAFENECELKTTSPPGTDLPPLRGYCEGQTVEFLASGGVTYQWAATGQAAVNSINGSSATIGFTTPGNATVCVTVTDGNGCTASICSSYVVFAKPTASITVLSHPNATDYVEICLNESLTFIGNFSDPTPLELGGYSWQVQDAAPPYPIMGGGNNQIFTHTFSTSGLYAVKLTVSNCLGCTDEHVIKVLVHQAAGPEISCPSVVCEDSEPVEYCASDPCVSPVWTVPDGIISAGSTPNCINVVWANPPASGFGTVTLQCSGAACPFPVTVEVPIIPAQPVIQGPTLICDNHAQDVIFSVPNWPGAEYTWSIVPADPLIEGVSPNIAPNTFSVDLDGYNGSFTVHVDIKNTIADCMVSGDLEVTVQDYNLTIAPAGSFCFGFPDGSPTFTVTPVPSPSPFQIEWTIANGTHLWTQTGPVGSNTLGNLDFNTVFGGSGFFNVRAKIIFPGNVLSCDALQTDIDIEDPVSPVTSVTGNINVCPNRQYFYTAEPDDPDVTETYEWNITGGVITSPLPHTTRMIRIRWNASGPYELQVRRRVGNCFSEWLTIDITQIMIADIHFTGPLEVCTDHVETYTTTDDLDNYDWYVNGGTIIAGQGTHTVQVIWHHLPAGQQHSIILSGNLCNMFDQEIQDVTILPDETPTLNGPDEICQNVTTLFSVTPDLQGSTYTWFVDDQMVAGANGATVQLQFPFSGTYTVRVRIDNYGGCPGTIALEREITVTLNPPPVITQLGYLICKQKGSVTLLTQVLAGGSGNTYDWYHYENGAFVPVGSSAFSSFYVPNGASLLVNYLPTQPGMLGVFQVIVNANTDCPSQDIITLNCLDVDPNPGEPCIVFTNWDYVTPGCGYITVEGSFTSRRCAESIIYAAFQVLDYNAPGFTNPVVCSNPQQPTAVLGQFLQPGVYHVMLIGVFDFDGSGPNPPVTQVDIREITIPLVTDFTARITCNSTQSGTFDVDLLNLTQYVPHLPMPNWLWTYETPNGTVFSTDLNPGTIQIPAGQTTTVCLTARSTVPDDENAGQWHRYSCSVCRELTPQEQTVGIEASAVHFCAGNSVDLQAITSDPNAVLSYHWTMMDPNGSTFISTIQNPTFGLSFSGVYQVTLEVLFSNGCTATATHQITAEVNNIVTSLTIEDAPCGAYLYDICNVANEPLCSSFTYEWNTTPPAFTSSVLITESGFYSVTVTDPASSCEQIFNFPVVVYGPFPDGFNGELSGCVGSPIVITVPTTYGYEYTFQGANQTYNFTNGGSNWTIPLDESMIDPGTYTFTITASSGGQTCGASLTGSFTIYPLPQPVPFTITYSCDPFKAVLQASQSVPWYHNEVFAGTGTTLNTFDGGTYSTLVTNQFGCKARYDALVAGPPNVEILTGCYCIEPDLVNSGQAIVEAPHGNYSNWTWFLGTTPLQSCATPPNCNFIPDLVLQPNMVGDITLYVERIYQNSDGSTVTCSATSGVFCWTLGPCDSIPPCRIPEATTRTIACIEEFQTNREYHIHWDFPYDGVTHPCNYAQDLKIFDPNDPNTSVGNFISIDEDQLQNAYWHFEGLFLLDKPHEPLEVCWEIPFCLNSTGEQCNVAKVCPTVDNPQHNDDIILDCYDDNAPDEYCENISADFEVICDDVPGNGITHHITLDLSAVIPATVNTIHCPNFSFYITSITGAFPNNALIRVDMLNVPPQNGYHHLNASVNLDWFDEIGIDIICLQVIVAQHDHCWPNDGNICQKRFCVDYKDLICPYDNGSGQRNYIFRPECSREQGDGGVLYDYTITFPNETLITDFSVENTNPNGFNAVIDRVNGNTLRGQYLSYNNDMQFNDLFHINNKTDYLVRESLPRCSDGDGRSRESLTGNPANATLNLMPNPSSNRVVFRYDLPVIYADDDHAIVVTNGVGALIKRISFDQIRGEAGLDVSDLPNGVYQVNLLNQDKVITTRKMVVLKD